MTDIMNLQLAPRNMELNGYLDINLDQIFFKIDMQGNHIKVITDSFEDLRKVFNSFQKEDVKNRLPLSFIENSFIVSFFIKDALVAQSNPNGSSSWYGKYFGFNKVKIKGWSLLREWLKSYGIQKFV